GEAHKPDWRRPIESRDRHNCEGVMWMRPEESKAGLSRRDLLQRGGGVALGLSAGSLLAACGGGSNATSTTSTGGPPTTGTPVRGGTLTIGGIGGGGTETLIPGQL